MRARLGINIDHVATLRQARGENYPSVVTAAQLAFESGADQITIHLREDRRHIQDTDVEAVRLVTKKFGRPLNLEMGCHPEIIEIAKATCPDWVCLVPESREEKTTEGGLNLEDQSIFEKVKKTCEELKQKLPQLKISLFLEARSAVLEKVKDIQADAVEIHTGEFARKFLNGESTDAEVKEFQSAQKQLESMKVACHAGHGLTLQSVDPLLEAKVFEEYNIGHWVICQAVFDGLGTVVGQFVDKFEKHPI
jgi:pyridoxine 5-phosphate synthase